MTRKHFTAIANALAYSKPSKVARPIGHKHRLIQWRSDVEEMAKVCCRFNGNFESSRFYSACNYEE